MFQTRNPDPIVPLPIAVTLCPVCGEPMRIAVSKPSPHFVNIAERTYQCDACGQIETCVYRKD
jgi:C4-type Zn-finger protein